MYRGHDIHVFSIHDQSLQKKPILFKIHFGACCALCFFSYVANKLPVNYTNALLLTSLNDAVFDTSRIWAISVIVLSFPRNQLYSLRLPKN